MIFLIALVISLSFLIAGILRFKIHPFFALLLSAIIYGFITGMDTDLIIDSINTGFGDILGKIGLIILFGVVIGTFLEKSGGAMVIATRILRVIGQKSIHLAMMLTGYVLSIPIFADSAFLIMNPLNKALTHKAGASYMGTTAALAMGLTASHVLVPPTPGPIAAAGILGADLGSVTAWGLLVSLLSLGSCLLFATKVASRLNLDYHIEPIAKAQKAPTLFKSLLAVVVPILLILLKSVMEYPEFSMTQSMLYDVVAFLGTPVIALGIGVLLSLILPAKVDKQLVSSAGWIGESIKTAAPIILITGAGGIFGKMLQNSELGDVVTTSFTGLNIGLFLPFLLAACLKTTQGSSTVALITTASIVAPMMPSLGLTDPFSTTLTVLAIGAGSAVMSHANDSFFWVLTQLTGMNIKQGNQVQTAGTFVLGVSAMCIIFIISQIFG